ncbi:MAG: phosphatase PAP2 family protein [Candidatus Caenarcaniphilales bacterium]|nr:phosphatase PAP2 family protein [Candidatus Caenarcaniphilales bacterium]
MATKIIKAMTNDSHNYSFKTIFVVSLLIIALSVISYYLFDLKLAIHFHDSQIQWLYNIAELFSLIAKFPICLFLPFILFVFLPKKKVLDWKNYLFLFVCFFITSSVCWTLKVFLGRYRPEAYFEEGLYGFTLSGTRDHSQHSMPSGHASVIATFLTALALIEPKFAWLFYGLSFILSFARIIVGAHYLSDILLSWLIGFLIAVLSPES